MKKGKIIAYSVLGIGVSAVVYFLVKKMKSKKKALPDLVHALVSEDEFDFGRGNAKDVVATEKKIRPLINSLSEATSEADKSKIGKELIETISKLSTVESRDALQKWYDSRKYSKNGKFTTALKKLSSGVTVPLGRFGADVPLFDIIQRSLYNLDWKNA